MAAGLIGAALFYGDGVITPAISVLSAVEGLKIATPLFDPYVVPIALVLLVGLFVVQRRGTAAVGGLFGPVMLVWFAVLALLGIWSIAAPAACPAGAEPVLRGLGAGRQPVARVPDARARCFSPSPGPRRSMPTWGISAGRPLRRAWLGLVFPALMLNYFGQGALLLGNPAAIENPFYLLAPEWGLYPLVGLARWRRSSPRRP